LLIIKESSFDVAAFVLQGVAGAMSTEQERESSPQEKNKKLKFFMDIIYRVLNAKVPV